MEKGKQTGEPEPAGPTKQGIVLQPDIPAAHQARKREAYVTPPRITIPTRTCLLCGAKAATSQDGKAWFCDKGQGGCGREAVGWTETTAEEVGDFWLEEILTPQGPKFVKYNWKTDQFWYEDEYHTNLRHYVPVIPDPAFMHSLTIASGLRTYGTTTHLLAEMEAHALEVYDAGSELPLFRMFIRGALASWVLDALFAPSIEKFGSIFAIVGPSESGKGRFLTVARSLFYRSLYFLKTTKVPSLFRPLNVWRGALILDEADEARTDESSEFIEFLNARATGVPIPRFSTETSQTQIFHSFGNTVLALRKAYEDDGFNSRSVKQRAESSRKNDIPLIPPADWIRRSRELQEKLLLWRLHTLAKIRRGEVSLKSHLELAGVRSFRVKEAFLVLQALSEHEPGVMAEAAQIGKELQTRLVADKATTKEGRILNVVYGCLEDGWKPIADGTGFRLEGTVKITGEDSGERETTDILRAGFIYETLDKSINPKEIVPFWKGLGQHVRQQARREDGKKVRSILIVRDPVGLDEQFQRFVPDFEPKLKLFESPKAAGLDAFARGDGASDGANGASGAGPSAPHATHAPADPLSPPPAETFLLGGGAR